MNSQLSSSEQLEPGRSFAAALIRKGRASVGDIAAFRREHFADRSASRAEVEALFALDRAVRPSSSAWADFLAETVVDHVVWDARPTGVVAAADAEWLLRLADATQSPASFAVLLRILDEAHRVPTGFAIAVRMRGAAGWHGLDNRPVQVEEPAARAA